MKQELNENYGFIFEPELLNEIEEVGKLQQLKEGETLINLQQKVLYMPLLLNGAIKIMREDDRGDELLLYYIEIGDTCSMTLNCCMGESVSEIKAIAEVDTEVILVPIQKMKEWLKKYDSWMKFVFDSFYNRTNEMLEAIDTLAFLDMKERLVKYLKDKAIINHTTSLTATHKEIASDLNTSRVVISRLLKKIEQEEKIKLFRNKIEVLDY